MSAANRRSSRNLLIDPNFQVKYAFYFASSGLAVLGLLFTLIMTRLNRALEEMPVIAGDPMRLEGLLTSLIYDVSLFSLVAFLANAVFSFGFALYMTHRVAGAAFNIENYIKEMTAGNYTTDRTLRKSDDLQAVMAALRELASTLKSKRG